MAPPTRTLEDIVVADFSRVLAGPLAGMILGDLGADVVKVERPGTGDDTRAWGPPWHGGTSTYYQGLNRNKRSIALDLGDEADLALAKSLAHKADVLIENFRPGGMGRFGLGYEDLAATNPGLVYCSITGFGAEGEGASLPGYDLLAQAMGGLMAVTGPAEGPASKVGVAVVDEIAGLYAVSGILAALHARNATGQGQHVEVALIDATLAALVNVGSGYLLTGQEGRLRGNRHPSIVPYQTYRAADRDFVLAVGTDRQWRVVCDLIGRSELASDPRYATNADRVANVDALEDELQAVFSSREAEEWIAVFRDAGVPCGPVNTVGEAFSFTDEIGRDDVVTIAGGEEAFRSTRSPIRLSDQPADVRMPPPGIGEHDEEIRAWLEE